ncbi:MAG: OmpH family outer membrane protein [Gemmatimonadota bacterium]
MIARAFVAPLLVTLAAGTAEAQAALKIAYVNPQALFQSAPGRAEAQAAYQREAEGYRTELTKMSDALTALVSDYQKNESKLLGPEKEKRQAVIQAREDSLRARQSELEQQANERQNQLMAPIMETVRKVLEDIRAEDGYAIILSSEPGSSPILAADKNLDITERVVARLKTLAAAKPATPAKPPGAPAAAPSGVTRPRPPGV